MQAAAYGGNTGVYASAAARRDDPGTAGRAALAICYWRSGVSAIGVFLSASRSQATLLFLLGIAATFSGRCKNFPWFGWVALLAIVSVLVAVSPRMQRFVTLENTSYVKKRFANTMSSNLAQLAWEYPLGNGLAGAAPACRISWKRSCAIRCRSKMNMARIMLEQGVPASRYGSRLFSWMLT